MPSLHTSRLTQYVEDAIRAPLGYQDPSVVAKYEPIDLHFDTVVDQTLSPYSDAYFDQQLALYREISGRDLNQEEGELHSDDLETLYRAPNPTGIQDSATIAEYVRCVAAMLTLARLGARPVVLDMGAGHGLGSEVIAYTGCAVHAVDIDANLGTLSRQRSTARDLHILRHDLNFDDLSSLPPNHYDAAFFFQALHHSLRPWDLIASLKTKLKPDGVIAFVGEPIQEEWWRHWGVRLDPVSLFVARRSGWFESGWSHAFIRDCFERSGFQLTFFTGGYEGGEIGIATLTDSKRQTVVSHALRLGFNEIHKDGIIGEDQHYRSVSGEATLLCGRPAFRRSLITTDALVYGPYASLTAGRYEVSLLVRGGGSRLRFGKAGHLTIEVIHGPNSEQLFRSRESGRGAGTVRLVQFEFTVKHDVRKVEVRAFPHGSLPWTVSVPTIRRLPNDPATEN